MNVFRCLPSSFAVFWVFGWTTILAYTLYMGSRHAHFTFSPVSCWTEYQVWVTVWLYIRGPISPWT